MEFAYKLKELRLRAHMTQAELAKALFVSRTLVSKWESGDRHPSEENIKRLCELFNITVLDLLGAQDKDAPVRRDALGGLFVGYCMGLAASILTVLCVCFLQRSEPWTEVGGFMIGVGYAIPVGIALVWEAFDLRRRRSGRRNRLFSLFALLLAWAALLLCTLYVF